MGTLEMNSNQRLIYGVMVVVVAFFVWFIPMFIRGITQTPNSQLCHLNDRIRAMDYTGIIDDVLIPASSPAAVMFELSTGEKISFSREKFEHQLPNILKGDQLVKKQGSLVLHIVTQRDTLSFNLDKGCP